MRTPAINYAAFRSILAWIHANICISKELISISMISRRHTVIASIHRFSQIVLLFLLHFLGYVSIDLLGWLRSFRAVFRGVHRAVEWSVIVFHQGHVISVVVSGVYYHTFISQLSNIGTVIHVTSIIRVIKMLSVLIIGFIRVFIPFFDSAVGICVANYLEIRLL